VAKLSNENPILRRDLDLMPVQEADGSTLILVRDPLELYDKGPVALRAETLGLLALLDGRHSPEEIRLKLVEQSARVGQLTSIPIEVVESFINQLNEAYLLDNDFYRSARQKLLESFAARKERPPALAGKSYPREKEALERFLDSLLAEGVGNEKLAELQDKTILALVAPHIELRVGAKMYAASYLPLKQRSYDRVVILGVGHSMQQGIFSITDKCFTTPLGSVPADTAATAGLRQAAGSLASGNDFDHRAEHSIEFQVLFLQRVLEGPFRIVPVLCGSLHEQLLLGEAKRPRQIAELVPALDYLAELLSDPENKTLLVAGVDFSHVGPKFGDRFPAIQIVRESSQHDKALLACLTALDAESFCSEGKRVLDRYHVCGFSVLAMLLEILPDGVKAVDLGHKVWHETPTQSSVSFASVAFYKE